MKNNNWREQVNHLFFTEGKKMKEISPLVGISAKSISKYLRSLPDYFNYVEKRKEFNTFYYKGDYQRDWKRENRAKKAAQKAEEKEMIKREHAIAVKILKFDR